MLSINILYNDLNVCHLLRQHTPHSRIRPSLRYTMYFHQEKGNVRLTCVIDVFLDFTYDSELLLVPMHDV